VAQLQLDLPTFRHLKLSQRKFLHLPWMRLFQNPRRADHTLNSSASLCCAWLSESYVRRLHSLFFLFCFRCCCLTHSMRSFSESNMKVSMRSVSAARASRVLWTEDHAVAVSPNSKATWTRYMPCSELWVCGCTRLHMDFPRVVTRCTDSIGPEA